MTEMSGELLIIKEDYLPLPRLYRGYHSVMIPHRLCCNTSQDSVFPCVIYQVMLYSEPLWMSSVDKELFPLLKTALDVVAVNTAAAAADADAGRRFHSHRRC